MPHYRLSFIGFGNVARALVRLLERKRELLKQAYDITYSVTGIATGRHYPDPVHLAPAYAHLGYGPGSFPVAERVASEGLSLPLFPGISEEQLAAVVEGVTAYFRDGL